MARASLVPQVIDAIVAGLRAYSTTDVTFRGPTSSTSGVTVYDGPEWRAPATDPNGFVVIGYGGEDLDERADDGETGSESMSGANGVRGMATTRPRDQLADDVECVAFYRSGSVDSSTAREKAWQMVDAVHSWLQANPTCGVATTTNGQVVRVHVTARSMDQWLNSGSRCAVRFTISAQTRT